MWAVAALVAAAVLYALTRLAFHAWMDARLPADAPRIAFSLDDTWLNELGVTDTTYQQAMTRAGGRLVRFEPDVAGSPEVDPDAVAGLLSRERIKGVLLTGGGDVDPALYGGDPDGAMMINRLRDDFEIALIRTADARGLPILGICRGCQILNVAFGGTLRNLRDEGELKGAHFTFTGHALELDEESLLAELLGVAQLDNVYSFHGQAVARPGEGVRVAATGPGGVVEAVEAGTDGWIVGIQWHPEMAVSDDTQNRLFKAFVQEARR